MSRAIIYRRVSTDEQVTSGAGLAAQLDAAARWCASNKLPAPTVRDVFSDDGVSGSTGLEQRPQLLAAIGELQRGDVLLVAKRDRLGRDVLAVALIEAAVARRGARVVSAAGEGTSDDDPSSVLMRRMVDAFAEYERLLIGARTRAALAAKRSRGERVGHVPYGWRDAGDGTIEPNASEQAIVRRIVALRSAGNSWRGVAAALNAEGLTNRCGRLWNHTNAKLCGENAEARLVSGETGRVAG